MMNSLQLRLASIFIMLLISLLITGIGSTTELSLEESSKIYKNISNILEEIKKSDFLGKINIIFLNNFKATLLMIIPVLGFFIAIMIFYNTGLTISAIFYELCKGGALPLPCSTPNGGIFLFIALLLYPHTWIEYFTYSLALTQNLMLSYMILSALKGRSKINLKREGTITLLVILIAGLLLYIGAVIELSYSYYMAVHYVLKEIK